MQEHARDSESMFYVAGDNTKRGLLFTYLSSKLPAYTLLNFCTYYVKVQEV